MIYVAYVVPARTGCPVRYELTATYPAAAHAEAQRIGEKFGKYTYCIRSES